MMRTLKLLGAGALLALGITLAQPAGAAGCNGVVDIFKWGCAPWDNNNGPQFPYHRKKVVNLPGNVQVVERNGVKFAVVNGQHMPLVNQSRVISDYGLGIISDKGSGLQAWSQ